MKEVIKTFESYKTTYNSRLNKCLANYGHRTESYFLKKELDVYNEILEILNKFKTSSKPFGFRTFKDYLDISILEDLGFGLDEIDDHIVNINKIIIFIKDKQGFVIPDEDTTTYVESNTYPNEQVNKYPQVFSSPMAYELFKKLHESYNETKFQLSDYSFIYRMMHEDGYILDSFKPKMFIDWLSEFYNIHLSKLKTMSNCSPKSKIQNYNTVKALLQIN